MLGLAASLQKGGASLLTFVKNNLKLYLDFKSNKSDTLKFPSEGSTFFDDSNDYIAIPDDDSLDIGTGSVTVSAWIKPSNLDNNHTILDKRGSSELGINVTVHSADRFFFQIGDGTNLYYDYAGIVCTLGQWHHVCAVWNPSTTYAKFYIDGVDVGRQFETTNANIGNSDNTSELRIGKASDGYTAYNFGGKMANVAMWTRELSPEEIQSIMNKSYGQLKGVEKTSLKAWWALDDTVNTEKITNGDFSSWTNDNPDGWTISTDLSGGVESNDVKITEDANGARIYSTGTNIHMTQNVMTIGATYEVTIVVHSVTTGDITTQNLSSNLSINSAGTHTVTTTATATGFRIKRNFPVDMVISSVSVKEVQTPDSLGNNNGVLL